VAAALVEEGAEARMHEFARGTPTAEAAAEAVGCEPDQIVKSLVFWCDATPVLVMVPGAILAFAGAVATSRWGGAWVAVVIVGALLGGGGFAALVRGWELRVRTPLGSGLWLRVESFRRFLHESETFHAEEAAKRGVLREYTAWAVALGEIDRWERAVARDFGGISLMPMMPASAVFTVRSLVMRTSMALLPLAHDTVTELTGSEAPVRLLRLLTRSASVLLWL